jgi:hypothetical protein
MDRYSVRVPPIDTWCYCQVHVLCIVLIRYVFVLSYCTDYVLLRMTVWSTVVYDSIKLHKFGAKVYVSRVIYIVCFALASDRRQYPVQPQR